MVLGKWNQVRLMWVPGNSGNRLTIRRLLIHLLTGYLAQAGPVVFTGLELFCEIVVKLCSYHLGLRQSTFARWRGVAGQRMSKIVQ